MWHGVSTGRLREELAVLDILDRVYEYRKDDSMRDDGAYLIRQQRRGELLAQLKKLESRTGWPRVWRIGSAANLR